MTDSTLRKRERQFRTSGSVADEAAWLTARVRAGELEQSKLDLAACFGHEAALGHASVASLPERFESALLTGDPREWPGPSRSSASRTLQVLLGVAPEDASEGPREAGASQISLRSPWDVWLLEHSLASDALSRVCVAVAGQAGHTDQGRSGVTSPHSQRTPSSP